MAEIKLNSKKFQKNVLLNNTFNELLNNNDIQELIDNSVSVEDFFNFYNELFYEIPLKGNNNSHEYLIKKSKEVVDFDQNLEEIELLQNEINELRKQNLELRNKIIKLENGDELTSTDNINVDFNTFKNDLNFDNI